MEDEGHGGRGEGGQSGIGDVDRADRGVRWGALGTVEQQEDVPGPGDTECWIMRRLLDLGRSGGELGERREGRREARCTAAAG